MPQEYICDYTRCGQETSRGEEHLQVLEVLADGKVRICEKREANKWSKVLTRCKWRAKAWRTNSKSWLASLVKEILNRKQISNEHLLQKPVYRCKQEIGDEEKDQANDGFKAAI